MRIECPRCRFTLLMDPPREYRDDAARFAPPWTCYCLRCGFYIEPGAAPVESPPEEFCVLASRDSAVADRLLRAALGMPAYDGRVFPGDGALDDEINRLIDRGSEYCLDAWQDYKQGIDRVVALDPALLTGDGKHPVNLLDEAAVGLFVTGWATGLRVGCQVARGGVGGDASTD